jgi:hypothetical protein
MPSQVADELRARMMNMSSFCFHLLFFGPFFQVFARSAREYGKTSLRDV